MSGALDAFIDGLGLRLGRPVILFDPGFRVLAHTIASGTPNPAAAATILARRAPEHVQRIIRAAVGCDGPVEVQPQSELGIEGTMLCPVQYHGTTVGYLWILDADEAVSTHERQSIIDCAQAVAVAMRRTYLLERVNDETEMRLMRQLLSTSADDRRRATRRLLERLVVMRSSIIGVVVRLMPSGASDDELHPLLSEAMRRALLDVGAGDCLQLSGPDQSVVLLPAAVGNRGTDQAGAAVAALHKALGNHLARGVADRLRVGYGTEQSLENAFVSVRQAANAARVACAVDSLAPVTGWSNLGMFAVLALLPQEEVQLALLHPGIARFVSDPKNATLVKTLELYLDLGGDGRLVSSALSLHRATLRYRLKKIEQLVDLDLRDGDDRFLAHFALKWARISVPVPPEAKESASARAEPS